MNKAKSKKNWFPLGIAKGDAFCNRVQERKMLRYNIEHNIHTVLASPRRYGKTSLANRAIAESKLLYCSMDFTLISDNRTTQNVMTAAVGDILVKLMPTHKKALNLASQYFAKLRPRLVIDTKIGARIELQPEFKSVQLEINELLANVDSAAKAAKKRVVILMDEFQQIATINNNEVIEAAIRNAAQNMENTCIIFSGSNRHLLELMFSDSARPLFNLCERMYLHRIHAKDYAKYLQKAAHDRWGKSIASEAIDQLLTLTQCHSYYVNVMGSRTWRENTPPSVGDVTIAWERYVADEEIRLANQVRKLSHHQKLMLMIAAMCPFKHPTSRAVVEKMRASVASAAKSFAALQQQDFIYQADDEHYHVLDPALQDYLARNAPTVLGTGSG